MELTFCNLRSKEVINSCDGKKLGNIVDIVFNPNTAKICGIVVPSERPFFAIFRSYQDIFIPYHKIRKIGRDVIIVELNPIQVQEKEEVKTQPTPLEQYNTSYSSDYTPYNDDAFGLE